MRRYWLGIYACLSVANPVWATELPEFTPEQMLAHAYKKVEKALIDQGQILEKCADIARNNKLTPAQLAKFNLTRDQWRLSLLYLVDLAEQRCRKNVTMVTGFHFKRYMLLQQELIKEDKTNKILQMLPNPQLGLEAVDGLYYGDIRQATRAEMMFLTLPEKTRDLLINADEFKRPFDWDSFNAFLDQLQKTEQQLTPHSSEKSNGRAKK